MSRARFSQYAWGVTLYNVAVIVWGAVVRATGSGAGCGSHWPTCNGEVIPSLRQIETAVEFGHRLTSGLAGMLVLLLLVWAFRRKGTTIFTRGAAVASLIFVIIEGAIGALLVRLELTAKNDSPLRAAMIAVHLCNTLLLLAALGLTAWSGARREPIRWQMRRGVAALLAVGLVGGLVVCAAGAVTALGDTLFPSGSLAEGFAADLDPNANFLLRLRVIHPAAAVLTSFYLLVTGRIVVRLVRKESSAFWFGILQMVIVGQIALGVFNVMLLAPVVIQLLHLLLADVLWVVLVVFAAESVIAGVAQEIAEPLHTAALSTAGSAD